MAAQNIKASTQKFTEIEEMREDVVVLTGGNACLIIEVKATNFSLLSQEEQQAKIFAFASLLNSLSFPIQILIRNKRVDVSSYIKRLDQELAALSSSSVVVAEHKDQHDKKMSYLKQYSLFIQELIKVNTVLDKTFYIVLSFSALEKGIGGVGMKKDDFFLQAKAALRTKAESILSQLGRVGLRSKILEKEQLIKLFYSIYNDEHGVNFQFDQPVGG